MPGSVQKTELSKPMGAITGKRVIEFKTAPTYRNCQVDLTKSSKVELLDIVKHADGIKALVPNITQVSGKCRVIIDTCDYTIHEKYTGLDVSSGIREV